MPVLGEDLHEHRRESEDRVRREPRRRRDRLGQREERPVHERVAVDEVELVGTRRHRAVDPSGSSHVPSSNDPARRRAEHAGDVDGRDGRHRRRDWRRRSSPAGTRSPRSPAAPNVPPGACRKASPRSAGIRSPGLRRPTRWPAATRSSTSPARTSRSAGRRRSSSASAPRVSSAPATSSRGCATAEPRPAALISGSASGYYGPHGDERVGEDAAPGDDFLARSPWPGSARPSRPKRSACASRSCAPASSSTPTPARWRRCSRRSSSASVGRSPAAGSTCRGSTATTRSACCSPRSTARTSPARSTAPHRSPVDEQRLLAGPRARAAPARVRADPRRRDQAPLRRHGQIVVNGVRMVPGRAGARVPFRHPDLDEALADALGTTDSRPPGARRA